jgi:hypothetical protein
VIPAIRKEFLSMMKLRNLFAAAALAAGTALAGSAQAAPAGIGNTTPPAIESGSAATPVYHWHRRCWPVYRWVWTHWGWRYRYVGTRCRPRHHHWY